MEDEASGDRIRRPSPMLLRQMGCSPSVRGAAIIPAAEHECQPNPASLAAARTT